MREIVLDTETTGFEPFQGDRLVEIGAVELWNHVPTGETYHVYINPERPMPEEAFKVHGLGDDFLRDKPLFKDLAQGFLDFIKTDKLVIHNAAFDIKFLNAELGWLNLPQIPVPAVRHRQLVPYPARRVARFRNPGRGLSGTGRGTTAGLWPGHQQRRIQRSGGG